MKCQAARPPPRRKKWPGKKPDHTKNRLRSAKLCSTMLPRRIKRAGHGGWPSPMPLCRRIDLPHSRISAPRSLYRESPCFTRGNLQWVCVLDRAVQGPPYLHSLFIRPDRSRSRGAGQPASRRFLLGTTRRGTAAPPPGFPPQTPRDAWRREREWRIHKNGPPGDHPAGRFP